MSIRKERGRAAAVVTRPHIIEFRPLIFRGNRADGAVVNTTVAIL